MKIAIMQPYFFPYIGYWQLMNAVDEFVVYDNIQFTKKGWIQRNRILVNGSDGYISLTIKNDSDFLDVKDRTLSPDFEKESLKILRRIEASYRKAPYFNQVFDLLNDCLCYNEKNLFGFIYYSIIKVKEFLSIDTKLRISSELEVDANLKNVSRVIATCKVLNAEEYINPIGGTDLYDKKNFSEHNITLKFLKPMSIVYKQNDGEFIHDLSIIDVMMFNSKEKITEYLNTCFTLI